MYLPSKVIIHKSWDVLSLLVQAIQLLKEQTLTDFEINLISKDVLSNLMVKIIEKCEMLWR
jgi:hypothetical protein